MSHPASACIVTYRRQPFLPFGSRLGGRPDFSHTRIVDRIGIAVRRQNIINFIMLNFECPW